VTETPLAPPVVAFSDLHGSTAPQPAAAPAPAPAPAPTWRPIGLPVTPPAFDAPEAVQARETIKNLIGDRKFFEQLKSERERGVMGEACQKWTGLHKIGWPSPTAPTSVEDAAKQEDARAAEMWNAHIGALKQRFPITPPQEAELRGGVINADLRQWAVEEKDRLVKDRGFYLKLLNGDRTAAQQWGLLTSMLSLRPVKDYRSPHAS
jgi:hypothetical protein